jgi:hypothetical protein
MLYKQTPQLYFKFGFEHLPAYCLKENQDLMWYEILMNQFLKPVIYAYDAISK